jgi:hypothetical protein
VRSSQCATLRTSASNDTAGAAEATAATGTTGAAKPSWLWEASCQVCGRLRCTCPTPLNQSADGTTWHQSADRRGIRSWHQTDAGVAPVGLPMEGQVPTDKVSESDTDTGGGAAEDANVRMLTESIPSGRAATHAKFSYSLEMWASNWLMQLGQMPAYFVLW